MKAILSAVAGLLISLAVGAVTGILFFVLFVRLTGPHSPLVFFAGVLALVAMVISNVLWQRRRKRV